MAFRTIGLRTIVLSTGLAIKSTGKPALKSTASSIPTWFYLGAAFSRFGLHVINATTVAGSSFTISLMGSLSTNNPALLGASKFQLLVQATSANLGGIKFSTSIIPATYVFLRSTKLTTAANRKYRVEMCAVPG
jgi:hypothetical protein